MSFFDQFSYWDNSVERMFITDSTYETPYGRFSYSCLRESSNSYVRPSLRNCPSAGTYA